MRTIKRASAFKRDFKKVTATPRHRKDALSLLAQAIETLLVDEPSPVQNRDHALIGDWKGYRECHIKPDFCSFIANQTLIHCIWHD